MGRTNPRSSGAPARPEPVRTCVGCRERAAKSELIRIVAVSAGATTVLTLDPRRSAGGRGAHLHPRVTCLDLATRRKAWSRALRVDGPVDDTMVRSYVRQDGASDSEGGSPTVREHRGHDQSAAPPGAATDRKRSTRS